MLTVSKRYGSVGPMERADSDEMSRSVRMPARVWRALDADAEACRRSATKQLEAILTVYYRLDDVEMADVDVVRETLSPYLLKASNNVDIVVRDVEGRLYVAEIKGPVEGGEGDHKTPGPRPKMPSDYYTYIVSEEAWDQMQRKNKSSGKVQETEGVEVSAEEFSQPPVGGPVRKISRLSELDEGEAPTSDNEPLPTRPRRRIRRISELTPTSDEDKDKEKK